MLSKQMTRASNPRACPRPSVNGRIECGYNGDDGRKRKAVDRCDGKMKVWYCV